jgi:hypothetical protein
MNEDIKRLREAAQAILDNRKNHPGPRGFDQAIDRFQMAAQPELMLRLLDDAERYQLLRRGQYWSVINWCGEMMTEQLLDFSIDQKRKA